MGAAHGRASRGADQIPRGAATTRGAARSAAPEAGVWRNAAGARPAAAVAGDSVAAVPDPAATLVAPGALTASLPPQLASGAASTEPETNDTSTRILTTGPTRRPASHTSSRQPLGRGGRA
jgi:hypothetical protein